MSSKPSFSVEQAKAVEAATTTSARTATSTQVIARCITSAYRSDYRRVNALITSLLTTALAICYSANDEQERASEGTSRDRFVGSSGGILGGDQALCRRRSQLQRLTGWIDQSADDRAGDHEQHLR